MRILITGNMGYVGPVLVRHLRRTHPDAVLIGYDAGWFGHCLSSPDPLPETALDRQHFGDVRDFPPELLDGVDAVVHLAAVSNDPMGDRFAEVTEAVNHRASVDLAHKSAAAGVKTFVFASSCSVYGASGDGRARCEQDELNPLTAYARSKIATEASLRQDDLGAMRVRCLRFATACGMSPRLRLDLVLNDFVAGALAAGEITVLSDGTPWRPLIDVEDMARAIDWAATTSEDAERFVAVNVGRDDWNVQVRDLAEAVAAAVPGTRVSINTAAAPDRRSYKVDFGLYARLAPDHQPRRSLTDTIAGLREGLQRIAFADRDFRTSQFIRLRTLERLMATGYLDQTLRRAAP
ncbi:UDP-glucose 4-epimerase [Rhodoplanes serenus]|uniref:UDP-glucose 4-epimerase n=1 Tax=Rhodoplanes serenus TaxID=200615 RepID=A0A3S4FCB7_9BRAD|nr:SDR family oxidoreductase [Rhodoplanes serenus]VCU10924.1 UDP-glucose 4-epimerase [Rhodoplanes serenus]